mmetsp:Transcript_30475/g.94114  ORF Transcript_30475/g.94114 Transcript_30475/m.94114 type:complete len:555 (-) Transcript_30475:129-1793(-)
MVRWRPLNTWPLSESASSTLDARLKRTYATADALSSSFSSPRRTRTPRPRFFSPRCSAKRRQRMRTDSMAPHSLLSHFSNSPRTCVEFGRLDTKTVRRISSGSCSSLLWLRCFLRGFSASSAARFCRRESFSAGAFFPNRDSSTGFTAAPSASADDDAAAAAAIEFGPDDNGEHSVCPYPCPRKLPCGHQCTRTCGEPCGGCPHERIVERSCGMTVISGFAEGKPTYSRMPHFGRKLCSGTAAEGQADAVETALGPCREPAMGQCTRCQLMYPCACADAAVRPLCPGCETKVNELMTHAQLRAFEVGVSSGDVDPAADPPCPFDIAALIYQTCLMNDAADEFEAKYAQRPMVGGGAAEQILNGDLPEEEGEEGTAASAASGASGSDDDDGSSSDEGSGNDTGVGGDDDDNGPDAGGYNGDDDDALFIPDLSMQLEALSAFVDTAPEEVRAQLETHWKRETIRNTLLAKKTALEASTHGPEANPLYKAEAERVARERQQQQELAAAVAATERQRSDALVRTVQAALKAQVEINADIEVQTRAITDAIRREVESVG